MYFGNNLLNWNEEIHSKRNSILNRDNYYLISLFEMNKVINKFLLGEPII